MRISVETVNSLSVETDFKNHLSLSIMGCSQRNRLNRSIVPIDANLVVISSCPNRTCRLVPRGGDPVSVPLTKSATNYTQNPTRLATSGNAEPSQTIRRLMPTKREQIESVTNVAEYLEAEVFYEWSTKMEVPRKLVCLPFIPRVF